MADDPAGDDLDDLWARYKAEGSHDLRDELIVRYAPLVQYVANRVAGGLPQSVDVADLVSYGTFGLIDAIEKFDLDRGFKFETYAVARVKGSILDQLRAADWVPRSVRAKARAIERASATLEAKLRRSPTEAELADELDLTTEQLQTTLGQVSMTGLAALDEKVSGSHGDDATTLGDTLADARMGPVDAYEVEEMRQLLADSINQLPERERKVLALYYYEGLTLAEIGTLLGVTESRICQIHTKSVIQLRVRMAAAMRESA